MLDRITFIDLFFADATEYQHCSSFSNKGHNSQKPSTSGIGLYGGAHMIVDTMGLCKHNFSVCTQPDYYKSYHEVPSQYLQTSRRESLQEN